MVGSGRGGGGGGCHIGACGARAVDWGGGLGFEAGGVPERSGCEN